MKKLIFVSLLVASAAFAGEVVKRGEAIPAGAKLTPLADVVKNPEAYTKDAVVTEGVVETACTKMGCWMQMGGMRVTFKDYGFFVPKDSKGMTARIAGTTEVKTLSKEEADHLAHEGAQLNRNEDGTAREVSFVATGVELTK